MEMYYEFDIISDSLDAFFESFDLDPVLSALDEASYEERAKKEILRMEVLDIDNYVKTNDLKPITNPTFFSGTGAPTSDGLLSNEIFGITQKERSGTFAYIDLGEYFIDPSCYKTLLRLDNNFAHIVKGTRTFSINSDGELVADPEGHTGIKWLKANFSKIKFKRTDSRARDMRIRYLDHNFKRGVMFINKYIVIPPFYRDVNTTGRHAGVGQINTFYVHLISTARAIMDNDDYGLSIADTTCARMQDTIKAIYDWFCGNTNDSIKDKGTGLGGKTGIIRANTNYTSDYSSRLVISAPDVRGETIDDLMVSLDKSAMPLAAVAADFFPFMIFHMRKFFENEFLNVTNYEVVDAQGNVVKVELEDVMIAFNDDVLKDQLKKFVYSHDTRFTPVYLPVKNTDKKYGMIFRANIFTSTEESRKSPEPTLQRPLTWVDVIYIAAVKSTEGKYISFTRFPYDRYFNTIYTGIEVASTRETEPLYVNGEFYKYYPKIRMKDINTLSSQAFVDTMRISNLYLKGMGGDYDGDMGQVKGSFFKETNEEIANYVNSKSNFIGLDCNNIRITGMECTQALFNLTLALNEDKDKLTQPEF